MAHVDFFTETLFSAMSSMQKEKPKQLNPLLPGYALRFLPTSHTSHT
jgi:AraC family transcriptional regulator of arabinose operon